MCSKKGNFEIHITVSERDEWKFRMWCHNKRFKPIKAVSKTGICPRQLMFSTFKYNTLEYVLAYTYQIRKEILNQEITVLRTKVEANINNSTVPSTHPHPTNYYEFHFKPIITTTQDWNLLDRECTAMSGPKWDVAYSINTIKRDLIPIVTVRVYQSTRDNAITITNAVLADFGRKGIICNDQIQREYSVYDDNQDLDKGWIIVASDLV